MRRAIYCLIIVLFPMFIQASTWTQTLGGSGRDQTKAVRQTPDGGFVLAGTTQVSSAGNLDAWVIRLNAAGAILWQKSYGTGSQEIAYDIALTNDNGFVFVGSVKPSGVNYDIWCVKLDSNGNISWQKTYGGRAPEEALSVQQTHDGGFIVGGYSFSFSANGEADAVFMKLDSLGNIQWQKTYGYANPNDSAEVALQTLDGGFLIAGYSGGGVYTIEGYCIKLDPSGNVSWVKSYQGTDQAAIYSALQAGDGNYVVAGTTYTFHDGWGYDAWVAKLDASGGIKWQTSYGENSVDYARSIQQTKDGGFIVAGTTTTSNGSDAWTFKLNGAGNVAWQKIFGGRGKDELWDVAQTDDGGYVFSGTTESLGAGGIDAFVLRTSGSGSTCRKTLAPAKTYKQKPRLETSSPTAVFRSSSLKAKVSKAKASTANVGATSACN